MMDTYNPLQPGDKKASSIIIFGFNIVYHLIIYLIVIHSVNSVTKS